MTPFATRQHRAQSTTRKSRRTKHGRPDFEERTSEFHRVIQFVRSSERCTSRDRWQDTRQTFALRKRERGGPARDRQDRRPASMDQMSRIDSTALAERGGRGGTRMKGETTRPARLELHSPRTVLNTCLGSNSWRVQSVRHSVTVRVEQREPFQSSSAGASHSLHLPIVLTCLESSVTP